MSGTVGLADDLATMIDRVCEADPTSLADGETLVALRRQRERLEAALTRATAAFDASGEWKDDGARSAAAWLAACTKAPVATARRRVRMGRELRHLGELEAAWLAGEVGEAQVGLMVNARTPATEQCLARDQDMLVDHARRMRFGAFARAMAYWSQHADPDGADDDAAAHDRRRLHLSQSLGGRWVLDGILDPIGGSIVAAELRRISKPSCSGRTGTKPRPGWATTWASPTWPAPRPSAGPTPWWRWPPARPPPPPTAAGPSPCREKR